MRPPAPRREISTGCFSVPGETDHVIGNANASNTYFICFRIYGEAIGRYSDAEIYHTSKCCLRSSMGIARRPHHRHFTDGITTRALERRG